MPAATGSSRTAASCWPASSESGYVANIDGNQVLGRDHLPDRAHDRLGGQGRPQLRLLGGEVRPAEGRRAGPAGRRQRRADRRRQADRQRSARHLRARPAGVHRQGGALRRPARRQGRRLGRQAGREVLGPGQRADALARHAPRLSSRALELRRVVGAHGGLRRGDQGGRSDGQGGGLLQLGLDRPVLFRHRRRQGQLPHQARLAGKHDKMPLGEWFIKKCGDYKKETRQAAGGRDGRPLVSAGTGQGKGRRTWARDSTRS